jgi:hypothetical protein
LEFGVAWGLDEPIIAPKISLNLVVNFGRKKLFELKPCGPKVGFVNLSTNSLIYLSLGEIKSNL